MTDYSQVLTYRYPGKEWRMADETYESLEWLDDSPLPTREELDSMWESVHEEIQAQAIAAELAKESALAKLAKLGLTPEEIQALLG